MLKVGGRTKDGLPLLILGLSDENIRRLRSPMGDEGLGEPIDFTLDEPGMPLMQIVIISGKTEEGMLATLQEFIT